MGGCVSRQSERLDDLLGQAKAPFDSPLPPATVASASVRASLPPTPPDEGTAASARGTPVPMAPPLSNGSATAASSRSSSLKRLHQVNNNNNNGTPPPGYQPQHQHQHQLQSQQQQQVFAMFDYVARTEGEVTFFSGDLMYLITPVDTDWWYVEHQKTCVRGYVPTALVALGNSLDSKSWFAGPLPRKEAERQLLAYGNPRGTFLVRESGTVRESYSLSVLDCNEETGRDVVKHYRIRLLDNGAGCCIATRYPFPSIQALVESYSQQASGLCCRLTQPCPRPTPTIADLSYQTRDQWEIPREQIKLVEQLGSGQFGEVWRGLFNGRHPVAVKMLKAGSMSRADFLKEARIMKQLRHPKLVQLFAVCTGEDPVYIVTELMCRGSLLNHLRESRPRLELGALVDILGQVASGMAYLEAERFIHRDLAARNILVDERNCVKVADFGLSRAIGDSEAGEYTAKQGAKFPIKWTSPEAALLGRFSIKSDVWSFGVVIFEAVTHGQIPYASMSNTETLNAVQDGYRMPQPAECPDPLYELMLSCWDASPDVRPSFASLAEYLEEYFPALETGYRDSCAPQIV